MGFTQIGKITKHKGLKGYCILRLNLDIEFDFKNINSLYLELRGSKVPFSWKAKQSGLKKLWN